MEQTDLFTKPTKAKAVEKLLREKGWDGATNWELNQITFRYGAVIHRLRQDGHVIDTVPLDPKNGLYKFRWVS